MGAVSRQIPPADIANVPERRIIGVTWIGFLLFGGRLNLEKISIFCTFLVGIKE
jgi:hypothetical protein